MADKKKHPKSRPYSIKAIQWLRFVIFFVYWSNSNRLFSSFMNEKPQFKNHKICHYLNGGEKICTLENMTFTPDGFCSIQGHDHYFQVRKSFCI